jgi:RNA polymerase sigma-70 factor (ECF subfamily)
MADVLPSVELVADGTAAIPAGPRTVRFPDGHAADDARLVRAARDGDAAAFSTLYGRYARVVHGLLLAKVGREDVEDLVQDVFLTAWRRLDDLRDPAAFGGWLVVITRNRAMDFHRHPTTFVELPADLAVAGATGDRAEARAALAAIRALPEAYRETLMLRLVEGLSGPEIAARTGLTPASVRVNLHRGMKLLREKLHR